MAKRQETPSAGIEGFKSIKSKMQCIRQVWTTFIFFFKLEDRSSQKWPKEILKFLIISIRPTFLWEVIFIVDHFKGGGVYHC